MSLESLERKHKALAAVIAAYRAFADALAELPPAWATEVRAELGATALEHVDGPRARNVEKPALEAESEETPPGPYEAIKELLSEHPSGLRPSEIVAALADRISTTSKNPKKLLYSAIIGLRRQGKIAKTAEGKYRLTNRLLQKENKLNLDA